LFHSPTVAGLLALVNDRNAPQKHVWRAEIVLLSAGGAGTNAIMRQAAQLGRGLSSAMRSKLDGRNGPSSAAPPHGDRRRPRRSANEKAARNMSSGPPGSKFDYLKTQPAPVFTDCTNRAEGANQKCCSIKGTNLLGVFLTR
jgi:hypothetical protein